jgi:outer membrane lipoprotein-sorting protein
MRRLIFCCVLSLIGVNAVLAQGEEELVKQVKAKLDKVNDYRAEGRMKMDVTFIDAPPSKITVYYKKPDRFKVVKNGGISILPKGGVSINLGSLLANKDYEVVPAKDATINGTAVKVVKLLPSDENSDVVLTTLYIEEKEKVILRANVTTRENGTYQIDLNYGRFTDWGLPDKVVFSFNTKDYKMPKGITFEYEKGEKKKEEIKNKKGSVEITYASYTINKGVDDSIFAKGN